MARIARRLDFLEATLADGRPHLLGEAFSVADAYAFVIAGWAGPKGIDLAPWPHLRDYLARIAERPGVARAMRREGLLH